MRVYVLYSPLDAIDVYDGTRLRKNLKGALEECGVKTVDSLSDLPDLVHVLSPIHEKEAVDLTAMGYDVVCSALYAENDPEARYLEYGVDGKPKLSAKAKVLLTRSKAVYVPSAYAERLVKRELPEVNTLIVPPPSDPKRYQNLDEVTKGAFYRYFMVRGGHEHAFLKGDYDDEEGLEAVLRVAELLKDIDFYFFGLAKSPRKTASKKHRLNVKTPDNIRFCDSGSDDLYRSGLTSSAFYLSLSYRHNDPIGTYEAFASGVQVFRLGPSLEGDPLYGDGLAYGCLTPEELALKVSLYRKGELRPTISAEQEEVRKASPANVGKAIVESYKEVLKGAKDD